MRMNAKALLILSFLVATSLAQLQVDYFYAELPDTCNRPHTWDYAYSYSKLAPACDVSQCKQVYGEQGANFTRSTDCSSSVQVSSVSSYMIQIPCNSPVSPAGWNAAYYRITSCVPKKDSTTYQLTLFDGQDKVFTVFQCKDKYCGDCHNFDYPKKLAPNQCTDNLFTYLFP